MQQTAFLSAVLHVLNYDITLYRYMSCRRAALGDVNAPSNQKTFNGITVQGGSVQRSSLAILKKLNHLAAVFPLLGFYGMHAINTGMLSWYQPASTERFEGIEGTKPSSNT